MCKKGLFSMFFLIAELGLIRYCLFLAIFRAFKGLLGIGTRVCLSLVKKVSKIGLFWLSLFLVYFDIVESGE